MVDNSSRKSWFCASSCMPFLGSISSCWESSSTCRQERGKNQGTQRDLKLVKSVKIGKGVGHQDYLSQKWNQALLLKQEQLSHNFWQHSSGSHPSSVLQWVTDREVPNQRHDTRRAMLKSTRAILLRGVHTIIGNQTHPYPVTSQPHSGFIRKRTMCHASEELSHAVTRSKLCHRTDKARNGYPSSSIPLNDLEVAVQNTAFAAVVAEDSLFRSKLQFVFKRFPGNIRLPIGPNGQLQLYPLLSPSRNIHRLYLLTMKHDIPSSFYF